MKITVLTILAAAMLSLFSPFNHAFASEFDIGRMRVAIWPEHDDPGVLVIYDGKFIDEGGFPREETFYLPKGSVISDACSLSPKGQHFCQLYKQKNVGELDEIRLKLPYPNFYLSFRIAPFRGTDPLRELEYKINTNHTVKKLIVDIEEPLRSEGFSVIPGASEIKEDDGLKHYLLSFEAPDKGVIPIKISYKKSDNRPSVDIKYSPMAMNKGGGGMPMSYPLGRRSFISVLYLMGGSGAVVLALMLWLVFRKKKS